MAAVPQYTRPLDGKPTPRNNSLVLEVVRFEIARLSSYRLGYEVCDDTLVLSAKYLGNFGVKEFGRV